MKRAAGVSMKRAAGVRLIVLYKFGKAVLQVTIGAIFVAVVLSGGSERIHDFALGLRDHGVSAWSIRASSLLVTATTPGHLALTAVALGLDGVLSFIEGWSLWRGYTWGPWLVVIATGSLIPFELVEIARAAHFGRVLILFVNIAIVVYLVRRALAERRRAVVERAR